MQRVIKAQNQLIVLKGCPHCIHNLITVIHIQINIAIGHQLFGLCKTDRWIQVHVGLLTDLQQFFRHLGQRRNVKIKILKPGCQY